MKLNTNDEYKIALLIIQELVECMDDTLDSPFNPMVEELALAIRVYETRLDTEVSYLREVT